MKPTPELIAEAQRVVPDLDELEERLNADPESVLSAALHRPRRAEDAAREELGASPGDVEVALGEPVLTAVERTAEGAKSAIRKIKRDGTNAQLDPEEIVGTEAIVLLVGRPAILIQEGRFFPPPQVWSKLGRCATRSRRRSRAWAGSRFFGTPRSNGSARAGSSPTTS